MEPGSWPEIRHGGLIFGSGDLGEKLPAAGGSSKILLENFPSRSKILHFFAKILLENFPSRSKILHFFAKLAYF